jgi:glycogen(starch) synthase
MTADPIGGVWTYALELAHALAPHGVEVALATMGAPLRPDQREALHRLPTVEVFEGRWKLEWMDDPWEDVARAGDWLLKLEDMLKPDIVHLNGYAQAALAWRAPTLAVGHSCVASWWEAVKGEPAPSSWDRYRREVARGLHSADLVLAPTRAMLAALERHYGPFAAARVVPNGRAALTAAPVAKEPFILAVGRLWDEAKNVAALERVAPRLGWPVAVAGEEAHPDGGQVRPGHVRRLGRLAPEALAPWFARASIYALPACYEPFGLSALEAALAGCALVLGDIPSLREVWGDAARFVPPDDADALQTTLDALIEDELRRADLVRRARARASEFTPRRMAEGYLAAYHDLLSQRRTSMISPRSRRRCAS